MPALRVRTWPRASGGPGLPAGGAVDAEGAGVAPVGAAVAPVAGTRSVRAIETATASRDSRRDMLPPRGRRLPDAGILRDGSQDRHPPNGPDRRLAVPRDTRAVTGLA